MKRGCAWIATGLSVGSAMTGCVALQDAVVDAARAAAKEAVDAAFEEAVTLITEFVEGTLPVDELINALEELTVEPAEGQEINQ